mmetsp:Transcript_43751/g.81645  ORF Transcript_43751/g.81645 Transcript_43751/m.81645 type:complete len:185 (+) Transcript_43751:37-591(+)
MWVARSLRSLSQIPWLGNVRTGATLGFVSAFRPPSQCARLAPTCSALSSVSRSEMVLRTQPWTTQVRTYNVQRVIPWFRVRTNVLKQEGQMRTTKNRNHAEVLKRFRLTRFGWERRRAHLRDGKKRRRSPQQKRNANRIDFVHRHDMLKMIRQATYFKLRIRDFPSDPNPNIRETRAIVGSHFG